MEDAAVRERAEAMCEALVAGDVDRAIGHFSEELKRNIGEVLALLPLPANEATIQSLERGGSGFNVVIRFAGETEEVEIQTRWKDRDGEPKMVEASHLSRVPMAEGAAEADEGVEGGAGPADGAPGG
ncbi:MAG TPA: hypothetical protein VGQ85_08240 [Candidatus Limnocylindrales bacterium]|nr:hypothetical protein [Candidatus Limnocylindrales bacterium]